MYIEASSCTRASILFASTFCGAREEEIMGTPANPLFRSSKLLISTRVDMHVHNSRYKINFLLYRYI